MPCPESRRYVLVAASLAGLFFVVGFVVGFHPMVIMRFVTNRFACPRVTCLLASDSLVTKLVAVVSVRCVRLPFLMPSRSAAFSHLRFCGSKEVASAWLAAARIDDEQQPGVSQLLVNVERCGTRGSL